MCGKTVKKKQGDNNEQITRSSYEKNKQHWCLRMRCLQGSQSRCRPGPEELVHDRPYLRRVWAAIVFEVPEKSTGGCVIMEIKAPDIQMLNDPTGKTSMIRALVAFIVVVFTSVWSIY